MVEETCFRARIDDLALSPETVCAPTWTDNYRLFMCKVHAEASNLPLVPKTFHRLAREMTDTTVLEEFVGDSDGGPLVVTCLECGAKIVEAKAGEIKLGFLPSDDFLETCAGGDYYCRDSCGSSCDPHRHSGARESVEIASRHSQWTPTPKYALLSHTLLFVHKLSLRSEAVDIDDEKGIRCAACCNTLGSFMKSDDSIMKLHLAVTRVQTNQPQPYIETRFGDDTSFFALVILSQCEAQSSLKLVVRSLDKTPHLLVWLLDSYVLLTSGDLSSSQPGASPALPHSFRPFPALKMLYKVFDASSAASDPRANGEDASVGLLDVPLGCCLKMVECLLSSSHALPPACRSVGQFYVGFAKLSDRL